MVTPYRTTRREFLHHAAAGAAGTMLTAPAALAGLAGTLRTPPAPITPTPSTPTAMQPADLIVLNGRIATLRANAPAFASAFAVRGDRFVAVGDAADARRFAGPQTRVIDVQGATVIPGLNDSHIHFVRQGRNYNLEVRWDGVDTLEEAMERLREQAARTPEGQWIRVVGGFGEHQFRERRMPTMEEIEAVAPRHPVFVLYLYSYALLNRRAIEALQYDAATPPAFPGGRIEFDRNGRPTGRIFAAPSALILYRSVASGPKLNEADQFNSSLHFQREMHACGVTSVSDCGGGGMMYPEAYDIITRMHAAGQLKIRTNLYTFAQIKGQELADYQRWTASVRPGSGDSLLRLAGGGENICWAAYDYEIFRDPRPDIDTNAEEVQQPIIDLLTESGWPTRQHMTYNETISRLLTTYESARKRVGGDVAAGPRVIIDHAETISDANIERIARLGGGIAIQNRIIYQAEDFQRRYGDKLLSECPPVRRMLQLGVPVAAGTDATRVSSHNPWLSLEWLCTGRSLGGLQMYGDDNLLEREEALRLWTVGSAWSTGEEHLKGRIEPGLLADFAVLDRDYFTVPDAEIRRCRAELTAVGGEVVHAEGRFAREYRGPALPEASPAWSPVRHFPGFTRD